MKLLWNVLMGFILINLLAAVGFVGWMYADGRINKARIDRVVDTFKLTIDQEKMQQAEADALEAQNKQYEAQQARLASTGEGLETLDERLGRRQQTDEITRSRMQFLNEQNQALRDEMARFKEDFAEREAELASDREAFEQWIQDEADKTKDENFLQVVSLYEKQPPKQTKQAFQALIVQGEMEQVVDYLAAMSSRKAAGVLSEFKTPTEVAVAAEMLERLRTRGQYDLLQPQASITQDQP